MESENTGSKQAKSQFKPGQSGNPKGRPKGARNKTTLAVEALLEGQHAALTQAAIDKALEGDSTALKLCLDRIAPIRKGRPVPLDLPEIKDARSLAEAGAVVGNALAAGELSSDEAAGVLRTLDGIKRLYETSALEQRIAALEESRGME
jgi:hypothetical protein